MKTKKEKAETVEKITAAKATEKLLTAAEVAEIYQVHKNTVLMWHRQGKVPAAVAIGKILRFRATDVAKAMKTITEQTEAERCPQLLMVI
jgi:excisionase family DNA binding protein